MSVVLSGLRRHFGSVAAVDGIDLEVPDGRITALVGPSGCGKTTTLRLVAGFDTPDAGRIDVHGRTVFGPGVWVPPERRRVGVVFQHLALFPHLDVAGNVGYGLRAMDRRARRARVGELLELVGLDGLEGRRVHELSGGQAQRVALARAMAPEPGVVLLDEPFSSLDVALRAGLRSEIRRILREAGMTAMLVTHDQAEALSMADRVAVMLRGRLAQVGTPEQVYASPVDLEVGDFVGDADVIAGVVESGLARTAIGPVPVDAPDGPASILLRPEHLDVDVDPDGTAVVTDVEYQGAQRAATVRLASGERLRVRVPASRHLEVGGAVRVRARPEARPVVVARDRPTPVRDPGQSATT